MFKKILHNKQGAAMSLITMLILVLAMGVSTAAIVSVVKLIGAPKVGENSYGAYEAANSCVQWYYNNAIDLTGCTLNQCINWTGGCDDCGAGNTLLPIGSDGCFCYIKYGTSLAKKINAVATGVCNSAKFTDDVVLCTADCSAVICGYDGCGGICDSCAAGVCDPPTGICMP